MTTWVWCLQSPTLRQLAWQTCHSGNDGCPLEKQAGAWWGKVTWKCLDAWEGCEVNCRTWLGGTGQKGQGWLYEVFVECGRKFQEGGKSFTEETCFLFCLLAQINLLIMKPAKVVIIMTTYYDYGCQEWQLGKRTALYILISFSEVLTLLTSLFCLPNSDWLHSSHMLGTS